MPVPPRLYSIYVFVWPSFSGLRLSNEPENIHTWDPLLKIPSGSLGYRTFIFWKIHRAQSTFNPQHFGIEVSMLIWDKRSRKRFIKWTKHVSKNIDQLYSLFVECIDMRHCNILQRTVPRMYFNLLTLKTKQSGIKG